MILCLCYMHEIIYYFLRQVLKYNFFIMICNFLNEIYFSIQNKRNLVKILLMKREFHSFQGIKNINILNFNFFLWQVIMQLPIFFSHLQLITKQSSIYETIPVSKMISKIENVLNIKNSKKKKILAICLSFNK